MSITRSNNLTLIEMITRIGGGVYLGFQVVIQ